GVENRYFVDGAEVSTPTTGYLLFELPYNFIRQVEIQTGGYQAEFPTSLGGIVNTVTNSGGNQFHGTIFGYLTNNNFSSSPQLSSGQPPKGNYANYDIGFGIGGPIIKDRLWYYLAYDPSRESEDVYVEGLNMQNSYSIKHKLAGKLTWGVNDNNMITLSVNGNPLIARHVYSSGSGLKVLDLENCTENESTVYLSSSLKGIHTVAKNFMLESALSLYVLNSTFKPINENGTKPFYIDDVTGISTGGMGYSIFNPRMNELSASIKGTLSLVEHNIKLGVEYITSATTRDEGTLGLIHDPTGYISIESRIKGTVKQHNIAAFLQDSWQISNRLCFNAGIRWDPQWLIASDGSVAQTITDQWQPRLGLIYQPGEMGTQKIAASFGRFYEPLQLSLSVAYHIKGAYYNQTFYPNDPRVDNSGAYFMPNLNPFVTNIPNLKGQYYDEFSLGYERLLSPEFKAGVRGIYRYLGQGIEDGVPSLENQNKYQSLQVYGNPGSGMLSMLPKMKREYTSLEFTLERFAPTGFNFLFTYVLSRNWGNYDGLAETSDIAGGSYVWGNATNQFAIPERMINADGLLPNDRTHVIKFSGSYAFDFGLTTGIIFQFMSGTPLNEFGIDPVYQVASTFLQPRGTAGRTSSIWDLNFRFMYNISNLINIGSSAKLILDVLHFASQRIVLDNDQYHYYDYEQTFVNPHYMVPVQFQPPMSVRLGMEVDL
ncbi:MAG TPA: TonB-dependent receptor, partial [Ignavibacteriaceae bacterium]|nr:TonB-dependent receptor [Ignavibacteriaceae bacterium]